MREAVIVSTARTPIGKAYRGAFNDTESPSMAALRALSSGVDHEPQTAEDRSSFAQTLLALARTLDSHVERYDAEVLPSILRALPHHSAAS